MSNIAFLEAFDQPAEPLEADMPLTQHPAYSAGYEAAKAEADAAYSQRQADLVEKITEMSFSYAEARQDLMQDLQVFLDCLAEKILPSLRNEIDRAEFLTILQSFAEKNITRKLVIRTPEGSRTAVQALLPEDFPIQVEFVEDTSLQGLERTISDGKDDIYVDADLVISQIAKILQQPKTEESEGSANGTR